MNKTVTIVSALAVGVGDRHRGRQPADEPAGASSDGAPPTSFSAVPGAIGSRTSPALRGATGVAERPRHAAGPRQVDVWIGSRHLRREPEPRVLLGGAELPALRRPAVRLLTDIGPNVQFPVPGCVAQRQHRVAARRRRVAPGSGEGMEMWRGDKPPYREIGVDARRHHAIVVVDAQGNFIEDWTQWDDKFKRPHAIYISPYDAQKHCLGGRRPHPCESTSSPTTARRWCRRSARPMCRRRRFALQPADVHGVDADGDFFVSDGYNGTRVAKFDKDGKFLLDFGKSGDPGKETRPAT